MSRVEDDREAARATAKLAEAKRNEEQAKTRKATENNAFSKLVGAQKQQAQVVQQDSTARGAIAELLKKAEANKGDLSHLGEHAAQGQQQESAFRSKLGQKALGEQVQQKTRGEGEQVVSGRATDEQGAALVSQGREGQASGEARATDGRHGDAKTSSARLEERKEASDSAGLGKAGGGARAEKGDLKANSDKGGGQQGGGKDSKDGPAANPNFRFNPALMAPVPVAKQKEATGSDRLAKVAAELAQKIVERVRVGTNAAGKVEFQVDLRSDVLAGLSVKVSAHNGKIKAVFSGSDRDVMKMIEEQGETLKKALAARGLTLEEFKTESRT
jgi:hypothetical protein